MNLNAIFQLKDKKYWWVDVIFYFVIASLLASVICYFIFVIKNNMQQADIKTVTENLKQVGTDEQKKEETQVLIYKNKINNFAYLLKNHQFASNAFAFMESQTMPNTWFQQFGLDQKAATIQLSGESDSMDALSRQVAVFEKNEYVQNIGTLSTTSEQSSKIQFSTNLLLNQSVFNYVSDMTPASITNPNAVLPATAQGQPGAPATVQVNQKLITSFHILLAPEVVGTIDQTKFVITVNVPAKTDIKNLTPVIIFTPGDTISPASNVAQDFSKPVVYTVVAPDGSTQAYEVIVSIAAPAAQKKNNTGLVALISVLIVILIAAAGFGVFLFIQRKNKKIIPTNL